MKLISVYTILPKEDDLQESEGISKFVKASKWVSGSTPKLTSKENLNKIPDSGTFLWNTLSIPENTPGLNFLSLNEEESNPWIPSVTGKLISLSGTPDTRSQITNKILKNTPLKDNTDRPLRNLYEGTSNFRIGFDIEDNLFSQPEESHILVLLTFLT